MVTFLILLANMTFFVLIGFFMSQMDWNSPDKPALAFFSMVELVFLADIAYIIQSVRY